MAVVLVALAYQSGRLATNDMSRQALLAGMEMFQKSGGEDPSAVAASARSLKDYPFDGAMSGARGDAYSLLHFSWIREGRLGDPPTETEQVLTEYRKALALRPRDGYLWSRYGLFMASLEGEQFRGLAMEAFDHALKLSPRDYNTMRVVADLGGPILASVGLQPACGAGGIAGQSRSCG